MVFSSAQRLVEPLQESASARRPRPVLEYDGRRLNLPAQGVTLGRSRECDIVVDDANVSRRHAELRPRGSAWVLSDLGSTNGTRLNGHRIERSEVVEAGDQIEVGASTLTFELD
jgi:pSer/pThr/pTyr-binding forkhead associated (FHA) protein